MVTAKWSCWLARPCDCECEKAPAKKTVGLLKCDACRQHRRCQYETGTSARPSDSSRTNSMSVHSAYNVGRVAGRVQDSKVDQALAVPVSLAENNGGLSLCDARAGAHPR